MFEIINEILNNTVYSITETDDKWLEEKKYLDNELWFQFIKILNRSYEQEFRKDNPENIYTLYSFNGCLFPILDKIFQGSTSTPNIDME